MLLGNKSKLWPPQWQELFKNEAILSKTTTTTTRAKAVIQEPKDAVLKVDKSGAAE